MISDMIDENFGVKEKTPKKLLNLFCLTIFIYSLIDAVSGIKIFAFLFTSKTIGYAVGILIYMLELLIVYLLYKRENWGWFLFLGIYVFLAVGEAWSLFFFFRYRGPFFFSSSPYMLFVTLCFHTGIIIFLNIKSIHGQFALTRDKRMTALIVSGAISFLITFILRF